MNIIADIKNLSLWDKFKRVFTHDKQEVLYRAKGEVKPIEISHYDTLVQADGFRHLPDYLQFCALAYLVDEQPLKEGTKRLHVPEGWVRVKDAPDMIGAHKEQSKNKLINGLYIQIWHHAASNEVMLAFRGTKVLSDWWANFRGVTQFIPGLDDHYDVLHAQIPSLVAFCQQRYGSDVRIVTTGHSLGGGLAQQALYASSGISHACAVNTSPVTGYYRLGQTRDKSISRGANIIRVYEHGEVLAYLRFGMRMFYWLSDQDPKITEARVNLQQAKLPISEHGIGRLAYGIRSVLRPGEPFYASDTTSDK